jgi:hypothetical protein
VPSSPWTGFCDQAIRRRCHEPVERLALFGRDHELARVATEHLLAGETGHALAGVVEEQDAPPAVEHADEGLRRRGQRGGEVGGLEAARGGRSGRGHGPSVPRGEVTLLLRSLREPRHVGGLLEPPAGEVVTARNIPSNQ